MATEYCFNPSFVNREPWGITPVSTLLTSIISSGSTIDIVLGSCSPCRLKFTTYNSPVTVDICIVAGNNPNSTRSTILSEPVSYLYTWPNGNPWARDRYQYLPSGDMVRPWGPSISSGHTPTGISLITAAFSPSNLTT